MQGLGGTGGEETTVSILKLSSTKEHTEPLEPDYSFNSKQLFKPDS